MTPDVILNPAISGLNDNLKKNACSHTHVILSLGILVQVTIYRRRRTIPKCSF